MNLDNEVLEKVIIKMARGTYLCDQIKQLDHFLRDLEGYGLEGEVETELHIVSKETLSDGMSTQTNFDRSIYLDNDILYEIIDILKKKLAKFEKELEEYYAD